MQRLGAGGGANLGGSTWWGMSWKYEDADRMDLSARLDSLETQIENLQTEASRITSASVRGPYVDQMTSLKNLLQAYRAASGRDLDKASFEGAIRWVSVEAPKALAVLRPLILADQQDSSGEKSRAALAASIAAVEQAQQAESEKWYNDPAAFARNQAAAALAAAERAAAAAGKKVTGYQLAWLKTLWPVLAIGGGVLILIYFGPALGQIAKRLASRGRAPTDLPPGTVHQIGE
jgi:hypothetical protein